MVIGKLGLLSLPIVLEKSLSSLSAHGLPFRSGMKHQWIQTCTAQKQGSNGAGLDRLHSTFLFQLEMDIICISLQM